MNFTTIKIKCPKCKNKTVTKEGYSKTNKQRYKCTKCKHKFIEPQNCTNCRHQHNPLPFCEQHRKYQQYYQQTNTARNPHKQTWCQYWTPKPKGIFKK